MTKRVLVTYPNGTESVAEIVYREEYTWVRGHGELDRLIEQQGCTVVELVPTTDCIVPKEIKQDIMSLVSCVSIVYHRKNTDYADLEHMIKAERVEKWLKSLEKGATMTTTPQDQPLEPLYSDEWISLAVFGLANTRISNMERLDIARQLFQQVIGKYEAERATLTARVQELKITTERRKAIKYAVAELLTHNYEVSTYYAEILERMADDA